MAAQLGKDLLVKLDDGLGGYMTVAGLRAKRLAFNSATVDITDSESAGRWRELLAASGVRRAAMSGAGIFKDAASDEMVRAAFFAGSTPAWQLVIPGFGTIGGAFQVTSLEYTGNHDGEVTFDFALESAGEITFVAAA